MNDQKFNPPKASRRSFLKMSTLGFGAMVSTLGASENIVRKANKQEVAEAYPGSQKIKTICAACSVGCGIIAEVKDGVWIRQEVAQDHPVSLGGHCSKGADMIDSVRSPKRIKYPMKKVNGKWERISWENALDEISEKLGDIRQKYGPDSMVFFGSAKMGNEQAYYYRKFAAMYGTNNIDHQARL
ncbi:formate dehydrogenase [Helicobacter sp. 13S00477-4]|nr:formate dehydrogenase [Helicobacter sp. 13S00477-4]